MTFLEQPLNHTRTQRVSRTPAAADPVRGPYRLPYQTKRLALILLAAGAACLTWGLLS